MEPALKRSRQQNDLNLNVRYWTRSRARPLGGIEQLHKPKEVNIIEVRKRKTPGNKTGLLDMNAHCILIIFEKLNLIDLSTLADTCKHLRKLAHYHFQSKYCQPLKYEILDFDKIKKSSVGITIPEAAKIFRHFGQYMRGLRMNSVTFAGRAENGRKLIFLIKEYCSPLLQDLNLKSFYIKPTETRTFHSLFKSLQHLKLCNTITEEPNRWSLKMQLCKSLEFDEMEYLVIDDFLNRCFPALEKITFRFSYDLIDPLIVNFIHRHPNLRHISIVDEQIATTDVLQAIGEKCIRLETLEFNGIKRVSTVAFQQAMKPFGAMKTLKSFTMNCFYNSVEGLLNDFVVNGVPIEHLHLKHAEFNGNAILHLLKLKTIKTLVFQTIDSSNVDSLFWIASKMPSLSEFRIKCYEPISCESLSKLLIRNKQLSMLKIDTLEMTINFEAFNGLVKILRCRPQPIKLNIEFFNEQMKVNVPQETLEANKQWIAIKETEYPRRLFDDYDTADEFDEFEDDFDDDSFDGSYDDEDNIDSSFDDEFVLELFGGFMDTD